MWNLGSQSQRPSKLKVGLIACGAVCALVSAIALFKYHIDGTQSAQRAVSQYADQSENFRAVVYQASLDKSLWRLALAAHHALEEKPTSLERKCSFAQAYWEYQLSGETVPTDDKQQIDSWYDEAAQDAAAAGTQMPRSYAAHLTYGRYLLLFTNGMGKVKPMLHEFHRLVELRPGLGLSHYWLAQGYVGSGDNSAECARKIIRESKQALGLDPRLADSYLLIASAYALPSVHQLHLSEKYIDLYVKAKPEVANRIDVVKFRQYFQQELGKHGPGSR